MKKPNYNYLLFSYPQVLDEGTNLKNKINFVKSYVADIPKFSLISESEASAYINFGDYDIATGNNRVYK